MSTTTSTTTNFNAIRDAHRAIAATQETLEAAYHAAERDLHAAQLYAINMTDAAHEAQDAVVDRRADLSDAERVARIAEGTAQLAWQEAHAAQEAESAADAAEKANWQAKRAARDALLAAPETATAPTPDPDPHAEEVTECSGAGEWACYFDTGTGPGSRVVSRHETEAEAARAVVTRRQWVVAGGHPHYLYRYEVRQWDGEAWVAPYEAE